MMVLLVPFFLAHTFFFWLLGGLNGECVYGWCSLSRLHQEAKKRSRNKLVFWWIGARWLVDHGDGLHDSDSVLLVFNEASQIINLHIHDLPKERWSHLIIKTDRRVQIWKFVFFYLKKIELRSIYWRLWRFRVNCTVVVHLSVQYFQLSPERQDLQNFNHGTW